MRQLERQWQKSSLINTEPDFQNPRGKCKLRELAKYKKDKQANFARSLPEKQDILHSFPDTTTAQTLISQLPCLFTTE